MRKRSVAMVYQQFINYPSLTVYENIASPLRVRACRATRSTRGCSEAARLLKLEPYLDRTPLQLSGGQQQRTAIARALVKGADLVLLDEPLANLDYKLREELRAELPRIFAASGAIFVYATTEPPEALLLGGRTVCMWEGEVTQFGRHLEVYRQPDDAARRAGVLRSAAEHRRRSRSRTALVQYAGGVTAPATGALAGLADGAYRVGFRAHQLAARPTASPAATPSTATVAVTEITGSESFVHLEPRRRATGSRCCTACTSSSPGHELDAVARSRQCSSSSTRPAALVAAPARDCVREMRMARIDLVDLAHSYSGNPSADPDLSR